MGQFQLANVGHFGVATDTVERLSDEEKGFTPYQLPTWDQSRNTAFKTGVTALLKQFGR